MLALVSISLSMSEININDPFIDIMTFLSRFAPLVMVMLIFSVFVRIILKQTLSIVPVGLRMIIFHLRERFDLPKDNTNKKTKIILVTSFMALSVFIVLIPHLDGLQHKVAEDTTIYARWIEPMKDSDDIFELLQLVFKEIRGATTGDRPLTLLILNGLSSIFDTVYAFEIILPALLAPGLVVIMYFLTKELTDNSVASFFSSFITAISFQVMIGMYAGFYATWIALIFGFLSVLFALRYLKNRDKVNLIWFSISMMALLFSHVYTWTLITAFFIIYLLVLRWKKIYDSKSLKIILFIVVAVVAIDWLRSYLIGLDSGIQRDVIIAESFNFGLSQAASAWSNIVLTVEVHLGGIFGNILILSLAVYCAILLKIQKCISYLHNGVSLHRCITPFFWRQGSSKQSIIHYSLSDTCRLGIGERISNKKW